MPNFVPVSHEQHASKRLQRLLSYSFASSMMVAEILLPEASRAAVEFPLVFIVKDGEPRLYCLLSFLPGQNVFVTPEGRWIGGYIPATLRAYPFAMARPSNASPILAIDESCPELSETQGEPLFEGEKPAGFVQEVVELLKGIDSSSGPTSRACKELSELGLLTPWTIQVMRGETSQPIEGLLKVDETKLAQLGDDAFLALRRAGGVQLAYVQLASLHNVHSLQQLDAAHRTAARLRQTKSAPDPAMTLASLDRLELKF